MTVEPCHCPAYDPACQRAGRPMTLRLWELCANQCPPERPCVFPNDSEAFRRLWDSRRGLVVPTVRERPCAFLWKRVRDEQGKVRTRRCETG
jgi:hypothetical protein